MTRSEVIENLKLDNVRLRDELDDCKHKLFSLQNDNRNKGGLIQSLKEKQSSSKNLFMKSSEETVERLEKDNRMLKASDNNLRQTLQAKEKQINTLEKNELSLLDKMQRYEAELANLQKLMD
jgi:predicted  nucleic acid-binding Zn-ribbon protein